MMTKNCKSEMLFVHRYKEAKLEEDQPVCITVMQKKCNNIVGECTKIDVSFCWQMSSLLGIARRINTHTETFLEEM
jgi:hypothetical protein